MLHNRNLCAQRLSKIKGNIGHRRHHQSSEYLLTKVATILQSPSADESVSVLGNRNMNAVSRPISKGRLEKANERILVFSES